MLPFFLKYKEDKVINSRGYDREKNIMFNWYSKSLITWNNFCKKSHASHEKWPKYIYKRG
jgi:hypothetical protein